MKPTQSDPSPETLDVEDEIKRLWEARWITQESILYYQKRIKEMGDQVERMRVAVVVISAMLGLEIAWNLMQG